MTSVLLHYSEVALKGKNRSWFVGPSRPQHSRRAGRAACQGSARCRSDASRSSSARTRRCRKCSTVCRACSASRTTRSQRASRWTSKAWRRRSCRGCRPKNRSNEFPRVRPPRRSEISNPVARLARELGSRVWTARGWKVDLDHADLVISVEIVPGAAYCFMGRRIGSRRPAGRHRRPPGGAALRAESIRRLRRGG